MLRGSMTYQTRTDSALRSAFLRIFEKKSALRGFVRV